jgi:phosphomannomutase
VTEAALLNDELTARIEDWIAHDPDPDTVTALQEQRDAALAGDEEAAADLMDAFTGILMFGTAGLRGRLAPGPNRMNRAVVDRTAAGLAAYLVANNGKAVVIGYDARRKSDLFARDTAEIMEAAGITAHLLPSALPTPVTAYAIRYLGCDAGVMVTASHNPPDDNGYKVYTGDGSQIVPPVDSDIAACIDAVGPADEIAKSETYTVCGDDVLTSYKDRAVGLLLPGGARDIKAVYTAMHGVGGQVFEDVIVQGGFHRADPVKEQFKPDPRFPTLAFPNPEEPGAMDLSLALAADDDADVIIANDPDADRCAAGIRTRDGGYRMLTGDEVGALFGYWIVERAKLRGEELKGTFANSIVSGTLLSEIAKANGVDFAQTLTGFKWISKAPNLIYGYEEALGYCVDPAAIKDKDGINASLLMLELAAKLKDEGRGIQDVLDDLAREHGVHKTAPYSVRVEDLQLIQDAMARLRANPPTEIGGRPVEAWDDLAEGQDGLPPTDGLRFYMDGARAIVRPSGTEAKLKCYLEVRVPVEGDDVAAARAEAETQMAVLRAGAAEAIGP